MIIGVLVMWVLCIAMLINTNEVIDIIMSIICLLVIIIIVIAMFKR